jgi:outer membrane lipoprotein-sorting protein
MVMTMTLSPLSRRHAIAGALSLATLFRLHLPAQAAPARPARLSPQDEAELARVQTYLNDIKTLQSRFQQFSGEGGTAAGTIYLQRPGKMRIVYDDPTPILIVADGREVYYWDKKLQELSQINVDETPAWFLLRPEIKLGGDVTVTGFEHAPGALRIAMTETKNPDQGSLTLVMSERPLELRQWTVIDAQQKPITVALEDPHYGGTLNPNLFIWTEQRSTSGRGK